jgi:hypothetical protein
MITDVLVDWSVRRQRAGKIPSVAKLGLRRVPPRVWYSLRYCSCEHAHCVSFDEIG